MLTSRSLSPWSRSIETMVFDLNMSFIKSAEWHFQATLVSGLNWSSANRANRPHAHASVRNGTRGEPSGLGGMVHACVAMGICCTQAHATGAMIVKTRRKKRKQALPESNARLFVRTG